MIFFSSPLKKKGENFSLPLAPDEKLRYIIHQDVKLKK